MKSLWFLLLLALARPALADSATLAARRLNDRAAGAYALGRYGEAADLYEQAFAAKPVPELLYNAAQAHRFAGNRPRALQLYENCLRVYADKLTAHRDEIELHITELRFAVEQQRENWPTATHAAEPTPLAPPAPAASPPSPLPAATAPPVLELTDDEPEPPLPRKKSRAWVWGVVSGVVVAAGLAIGLGVGLSASHDPSPSLGKLGAQ